MQYKVYDYNKNTEIDMELYELTARITAYNSIGAHEPELLKAYALMARTELARKSFVYNGKGCDNHKGCNLCTEPGHCMEYGLADIEVTPEIYEAVKATEREIILFEGRPIKPFFHYRCGGATENSENVLGNRVTYLRRVLCSFCKENEDHESDKYFTVEELEKILNTKFCKPDGICYNIQGMFEDIEVDEQGKINKIKIGAKTFRGTEVMELLQLNSTRFDYIPVKFLVKCIGTGHGLGLCQCGASNMAKSGKNYKEILKYYYTGVSFGQMEIPDCSKPLKGVRFVLDAAQGGKDCNDNVGAAGLREKDVNLDITLKLGELLVNQGAEVYLTRDSDAPVALSDRAALANGKRPDFFLSIGQNSFSNSTASGTELYFYRGDTQGERLSKIIIENLNKSMGLKDRGIRTAEFYLLREVRASAVIIQLLYISNPEDEKLLGDEGFRKAAAEAISKAIMTYYNRLGNSSIDVFQHC